MVGEAAMALIKCRECGAEVSDQAAACIKCGAPIIVDLEEKILCWNCKHEYSNALDNCPSCGKSRSVYVDFFMAVGSVLKNGAAVFIGIIVLIFLIKFC